VEYSECLRYFERIGRNKSEIIGASAFLVSNATVVPISVRYTKKRIKPTITTGSANQYRLLHYNLGGSVTGATTLSNITSECVDDYACVLRSFMPSAYNSNVYVVLQRTDNATAAYVDVSADL
jgi:hypothetical protein